MAQSWWTVREPPLRGRCKHSGEYSRSLGSLLIKQLPFSPNDSPCQGNHLVCVWVWRRVCAHACECVWWYMYWWVRTQMLYVGFPPMLLLIHLGLWWIVNSRQRLFILAFKSTLYFHYYLLPPRGAFQRKIILITKLSTLARSCGGLSGDLNGIVKWAPWDPRRN